ncbi:Beta-hexosaminidase [Parasponia andersonii]|uniref:Beta-hexosaminidase n=1 Tax=Parasponia andersonii TaxID=3476 RepID=A0A2P5DPU8_PARAD|nr:Beta-hexosaminidase [Parasponia andersonii]
MFSIPLKPLKARIHVFFSFFLFLFCSPVLCGTVHSEPEVNGSLTYLWPLPTEFTSGNDTLSVDPGLSLIGAGNGGNSAIVRAAFDRYKGIIFKHTTGVSPFSLLRGKRPVYDITRLRIVVDSDSEDLQLGVDESYTLYVAKNDGQSIIGEVTIEANTVYGALRGLETFSQLCTFDYGSKSVLVYQAPWYIQDKPRFAFRGLLLDTSRHYLPIDVMKQIIDSMSYAKLNVLHWHVIDEQSFPIEIPSYPNLWRGAYTKWERYTIEDAIEIVKGKGYPDLWPNSTCREPLDVSKNYTFDVITGILTDMRKIFPFELFHLGGDEVNTGCWNSTPHVKQWLQDKNITTKEAYQYFVLRAQEIALSKNWTPVNWEETFNTFAENLHPKTVVHNWLGPGVCPKAVAKGFRCIFSNQGVWYLDHLDVPWNEVYTAEPLEGIDDASQQKLVLGGEVCMWAEIADTSNVQQTIWPRAAAAAERLWSKEVAISTGNINETALPRLHYFRCLLNRRGVQAAPVTNKLARTPPNGPGSCFEQ